MNKTDVQAPASAATHTGIDVFKTALDRAGSEVLPMHARLEGCEIIGLIGGGDFSIVYLAYDYALARHVAVKEYMPAGLAARAPNRHVSARAQADQDIYDLGLRSFLSEARLLARFDAPSLVKILRFWEANGTAYVAMPFYDGISLQEAVSSGRFDANEKRVRSVLEQLFEAVEQLHRAHCFHPDIAPDNILLLADGRPLLLDFGAARRVIQAHTAGPAAALKPGFAPVEDYEEISNLKRGPWTDVYALAAVGYFLISGKAPPPAVARMANDQMTPARQAGAARYSDAFLAALDHALAVMPQQRLQSVSELRRALGIAAPRKSAAGPGPGAGSGDGQTLRWTENNAGHAHDGARRNRHRSGFKIAALALGILAVVATAGFWGVRRNEPVSPGADIARPPAAVAAKTADLPAPPQQPPPASSRAADATAAAAASAPDEARWRVASSLNNISAYENYLADFPNGRHAATARTTLESLRARADAEPAPPPAADRALEEESLWSAVRKIDKPLAYESFLRKYPNGRYAAAARSSLARLRPPLPEPRPTFEPPVVDATRRPFGAGGPDTRVPDRPVAIAPAAPAAPPASASAAPAAPAAPPANAPASPDRLTAARRPEAPAAARLPQAAELPAETEAEQEAPPPPRLGRTLRVANQIMTGNFSPDSVTGLVSGSGRIVWDNGDQFDGTMVRGQKEGRGEFRWANGQRYRGEWSRDQPNGRGTIQFPNGDRYTGDMRNGLPNGAGTLVFANGNRYQGEVRDGQPNGSGLLSFSNGNRYRGEVRDGMPNGTGTNRYANGDVYTGAWRRGKSDGQGRYTWANGNYWEGEFRDGIKTANGRMVLAADAPGGGTPAAAGDSSRATSVSGNPEYETDVSGRAR
jgi:hypothetical protein